MAGRSSSRYRNSCPSGRTCLFQPAVQACHFAFTEAGYIGGAPAVAAVNHFALGGQQGFYSQTLDNRRGDETVGRGNDNPFVACFAVFGQESQGWRQDDGVDAVTHELLMPLVQLGNLGTAQDFQAEVQVIGQVQGPGQVILVERIVARFVSNRVKNPALAQVVAPGVIAVAAQKCVIEVE